MKDVIRCVAERVAAHDGFQEIQAGFRFTQGKDATALIFEAVKERDGAPPMTHRSRRGIA